MTSSTALAEPVIPLIIVVLVRKPAVERVELLHQRREACPPVVWDASRGVADLEVGDRVRARLSKATHVSHFSTGDPYERKARGPVALERRNARLARPFGLC